MNYLVAMTQPRYHTRSHFPRRNKITSPQTVSNLLEEFEMATLWVRSQHDAAKEKIFEFLQRWNDKGRKYFFQILDSLLDHFFNHHFSLHPRGERKTKPGYLKTFLPVRYPSGPVTLLAAYFWSLPSDQILPAFSFFGHLRPAGKPLPKIAIVYSPWEDRKSLPYGTRLFLCPTIPASPPLGSPVFDNADLVFNNPVLLLPGEQDACQFEKTGPVWTYETEYGEEASQVLAWIDTHGRSQWIKDREEDIKLLRRYVEGLKDVSGQFPHAWLMDSHVPKQLFPRLIHNVRVLFDGGDDRVENSSRLPIWQFIEQDDRQAQRMYVQDVSSVEGDDTLLEMDNKAGSTASQASHMTQEEEVSPVTLPVGHSTVPETELLEDSIETQLLTEATPSPGENTTREGFGGLESRKRKRAATKTHEEMSRKRLRNGAGEAARRNRAMVVELVEKLEGLMTWGQHLLRLAHKYLHG